MTFSCSLVMSLIENVPYVYIDESVPIYYLFIDGKVQHVLCHVTIMLVSASIT